MAEQPIIPASDQPVRIRWLNAAEQSPSVLKPTAQMAQPTPIKTAKLTAPSVFNKTKVKTTNENFPGRSEEKPSLPSSVDSSIQSAKGFKELSAEDKMKIANLIKELAKLSHEKQTVEEKLQQERRTFEAQIKTVLTDYEKLMKDNQKLMQRYTQTKTILQQYEKKSQPTTKNPSIVEFPNPQRSSTPIQNQSSNEQVSIQHSKIEHDVQISARTASNLLQEQFQLKQTMMEKQLELLQKQQQILESQLKQRTAQIINDEENKSKLKSAPSTKTSRATSPIKQEQQQQSKLVERATSPVKQPASRNKNPEHGQKRSVQTQKIDVRHNDEDLLILSLNESLHEPKARTRKSQVSSTNATDSEEQNLLKDIFFIC